MTESVKEPTISVKSGENDYVLSCDGAIKDAEPVTYSWSSNDVTLPGSAKEITVSVSVNLHLTCWCQFNQRVQDHSVLSKIILGIIRGFWKNVLWLMWPPGGALESHAAVGTEWILIAVVSLVKSVCFKASSNCFFACRKQTAQNSDARCKIQSVKWRVVQKTRVVSWCSLVSWSSLRSKNNVKIILLSFSRQ